MNRRESNEPTHEPTDAELEQWLAQWPPPELPARLNAAVEAAYRRAFPTRPWWWLLTASLRVPVPVAAAAGILLCAALWLAARPAANLTPPVTGGTPTKFVEVPSVQERLVTRVVYVRAKPRAAKRPSQPVTASPKETKTKQADLARFRPVSEIRLEVSPGGQEP